MYVMKYQLKYKRAPNKICIFTEMGLKRQIKNSFCLSFLLQTNSFKYHFHVKKLQTMLLVISLVYVCLYGIDPNRAVYSFRHSYPAIQFTSPLVLMKYPAACVNPAETTHAASVLRNKHFTKVQCF